MPFQGLEQTTSSTGGFDYKLKFGHPKAVEIAVGINGDRLFILQCEGNLGLLTGGQRFPMAARSGFQIDPLDRMLRNHGMGRRADFDGDGII